MKRGALAGRKKLKIYSQDEMVYIRDDDDSYTRVSNLTALSWVVGGLIVTCTVFFLLGLLLLKTYPPGLAKPASLYKSTVASGVALYVVVILIAWLTGQVRLRLNDKTNVVEHPKTTRTANPR